MPTSDQPPLRSALRWVLGMLHAMVRYLFHRVPSFRRGRRIVETPEPPDMDCAWPDGPGDVQRAGEGVGPLYHRRYRIAFTDADIEPAELISLVARDPNIVTPNEMARFEPIDGDGEECPEVEEGAAYVVRLPGPWNGPVRVVERTPTSFTLATLQGHLEAGHITFRAIHHERYDWLVFEIESFARSSSTVVHWLYNRLPLASEAQLHMWASFCEQVVDLAGGIVMTSVEAETDTYQWPPGGPDPADYTTTGAVSRRARRALDQLHDKPLNFTLPDEEPSEEQGWRIDDWCQPLPSEPPGDPLPDGSWAVCRELMADYEFADPSIVRAVYHGGRPLDDRNMVLEARFYGLRFLLGLRVGGVRDERITVDGRPVVRWGWNYRTLRGHLEMGQMDYEVWKWADTGDVEFRIHAFSKPARIPNPVVRLGFAVFGRWMQVRFARQALARMADLVDRRLAAGGDADPVDEADHVLSAVSVGPAEEADVALPSDRS